jgi:hypothetical protein
MNPSGFEYCGTFAILFEERSSLVIFFSSHLKMEPTPTKKIVASTPDKKIASVTPRKEIASVASVASFQ